MPPLQVEILRSADTDVNAVMGEIGRKYAGKPATLKTIADMERKAARLIRRLITTKVTFVRN
jgi:hypothetical protein